MIGLPDEKWGERPLALVVPKPDSPVQEKELAHHVKEYADKGIVNKQVVLLKVKLVGQIDKTSVGKINKMALREQHLRP